MYYVTKVFQLLIQKRILRHIFKTVYNVPEKVDKVEIEPKTKEDVKFTKDEFAEMTSLTDTRLEEQYNAHYLIDEFGYTPTEFYDICLGSILTARIEQNTDDED